MLKVNDIQIAFAVEGDADCLVLLAEMKSRGWNVVEAKGAERLAAMAASGDYHLALLAVSDLAKISRPAVHSLMLMQSDMGLLLLLPDVAAALKEPALAAVTSDQLLRLDTGPKEAAAVISAELESVIAAQPRYRIFCIDDDEEFLASMEEMLPDRMSKAFPRFHLDFDYFASPSKAIAAAHERAAELAVVICDQMMPEMKGVELLSRIKEACPGAQRLLLTGYAALHSAIDAINSHVLDKYLTKPIEQPADFVASVGGLLREHHLRRSRDDRQDALMGQFEFVRVISGINDADAAIQATAKFACEQMRARSGAVLLLEEGRLNLCGSVSIPPAPPLPEKLMIPADAGLPARVLAGRRPVVVSRRCDLGVPSELWSSLPLPIVAGPMACNGKALGIVLTAGRALGTCVTRSQRMLMSFIADAASVAISGLLDRKLLEQHYVDTMACLMDTVEAKDSYTRGHTERVMELSIALARRLGLSDQEVKTLQHAASLHDIGKIGVPDSVILKPDKLDISEFALMKKHPGQAFAMLQHLRFLGHARMIILSHHERYDGKGYPQGLAGEEIPLGARILALADAFDAMTSTRPYRQAMSTQESLAEIEKNVGKQFDPALAAAFVEMIRECDQTGPQDALVAATSL